MIENKPKCDANKHIKGDLEGRKSSGEKPNRYQRSGNDA
ncbi:hypothetical protein KNP414_04425 [Paenibacillus mucilaginosus KNP414]|uniref:Uncharacterized protein n=1 Tax=Paenibacillus mucilaginosus (strain KNP414) TaxID=1036673 RepID=F8F6K2_PAEMK|nr:hypothetical protein KNP414_04425 [Paenibacillus mucilaginosus KNP414]